MLEEEKKLITVATTIHADVYQVWEAYTSPTHITKWNYASDQWCCPTAFNPLHVGGIFSWRMEAVDGTLGFDFMGTYTTIQTPSALQYTLSDGRAVGITFIQNEARVTVTQSFEPENTHNDALQKEGWQAILLNFKKYVEELVQVKPTTGTTSSK